MYGLQYPAVRTELEEFHLGVGRSRVEPLIPVRRVKILVSLVLRLHDAEFSEICMEVSVSECIAAPVIERGEALPFLLCLNPGSVCLLPYAGIDVLFRIPYLYISVMVCNARCCVGIYHRNDL